MQCLTFITLMSRLGSYAGIALISHFSERRYVMKHRMLLVLAVLPLAAAYAGGSNYGITPGALPNFAGKVSEWPVPTPRFARDPAIAPDGSVFISVMSGNKIARFDPKTKTFKEWD